MNIQGLIKSPLEDVLINKLLLSHDPDGRCLDSEQLLFAMENIMLYATNVSQVPNTDFCGAVKEETNIEVVGSEKSLVQTIIKISHEMSCDCSKEPNLHEKTMFLFDSLASYKWDDKAVLALSAFAKSYGEFWLLIQLYPKNPLAVSVAMLKQLPSDISELSRQFKALSLLIKTVVDLTKSVIKFEGLPLSQVKLADEAKSTRELHIYPAVYWIIRSILTCSYQITDLKAKPEKYSQSTTIATWELSSLANRLRGISNHLKKHVQECSEKLGAKLYQTLLTIFKEEHKENQHMLRMLFAFRDDFPLIDCLSQAKLGLTELENKVVMLLVSKPELLPIEDLLYLIQQHNRSVEGSYEIVWIPIPVSDSWTDSEKRSFRFLSHSLPWCSIKQPWSLNLAAVTFIKREWNYKDVPQMVVLDSNGKVTNMNAMDMVFLWGPRAYPFSASREEELWLEQKWTMQFLVEDIDPLLTKWVEEERYICIYGSNNMDWILELNAKAAEIEKNLGFKFEMIYAGKKKKKKNTSEHVVNDKILAKIEDGGIRNPLSLTEMQFFWLRLESMQRSKLQLGSTVEADHILQEVSRLIKMDDKGEDWALIGRGDSEDIVRVEDAKLMECLDKYFSLTEPNKSSLVDSEPCCDHSKVIAKDDEERIDQATEACEKCGHPMKKFFVYKPKDS